MYMSQVVCCHSLWKQKGVKYSDGKTVAKHIIPLIAFALSRVIKD